MAEVNQDQEGARHQAGDADAEFRDLTVDRGERSQRPSLEPIEGASERHSSTLLSSDIQVRLISAHEEYFVELRDKKSEQIFSRARLSMDADSERRTFQPEGDDPRSITISQSPGSVSVEIIDNGIAAILFKTSFNRGKDVVRYDLQEVPGEVLFQRGKSVVKISPQSDSPATSGNGSSEKEADQDGDS